MNPKAQTSDVYARMGNMRQEWFDRARFGMFVHFGLYSGAARHEWVQNYERLTDEDYRQYFEHFDPDLFDAAALARTAKETGMGYVVLTTKHHDGFCLWGSKLTDYTSVANTGRDLVREYVEALRAEGLKVGLYHSVIDWHHPDFTVDWNHPRRDDEGAAELNGQGTRRLGRHRAARAVPGAAAEHARQRPSGHSGRLRYPRAVPADLADRA